MPRGCRPSPCSGFHSSHGFFFKIRDKGIICPAEGRKSIRGQGPGLVTSLVFFPCFVMLLLTSGKISLFQKSDWPSGIG